MSHSFSLIFILSLLILLAQSTYGMQQGDYLAGGGYEVPVPVNTSEKVLANLETDYGTCLEAWNDVFKWVVILYGDWYGNQGANSSVYYWNTLLYSKIPAWINICILQPIIY